MKKLIQTKVYLLLIDEEAEIKEGNIAIHDFGMGYDLEIPCDVDNLKSNTRKLVVAYYPLTKEAKELDLPLLPNPFRYVNIEELAEKWHVDNIETSNSRYNDTNSFIEGYKAAQSKQFSLEDMKKAIEMARDISDGKDTFTGEDISGLTEVCTYDWRQKYSDEEIIQTLSTQQLPKEFIPEYEEIEVDKYVPKMPIDKLKTIINSEGKLELVGVYIY